MARIRKIDTQNVKTLLELGELGLDMANAGDNGRVYVGTGTANIPLAAGAEIVPDVTTSLSVNANILTYTDELGADTNIDLSLYLDDTNLARLTSGTLNATTGIATFSRDDASTFTVDFSALFDDTNLARITSAGLSGTTITLTRDDASTVGIDLSAFDSRYEPKDTTILKDADIGINVQAYDINIVSDSAYVHTDNNYTTAEKSKLGAIEAGATADQTGAEIKVAYEAQANTNAFTDAEKTQVSVTETSTQLNARDTANRNTDNHTDGVTNGVYTLTERSKLAGVEVGATADQTKADIDALGIAAATVNNSTVTIPASQVSDFDTEVANNTAVTANTAKVTNVTTNLATTYAASTVTVTSSDGTDAVVNAATISNAGVMSAADKARLDALDTAATW